MDRDSIAELFFSNMKNPKTAANNVLLRLLRDGRIQRSTLYTPYVYFGEEVEMKKSSAKIPHFLAILNVYKEIRAMAQAQNKVLETFQVEPKYLKKGCAEPDIFCRYRETNFFIEVQRTVYSEKQMQEKMDRYLELYNSGIMAQPFPRIVILTDTNYALGDYPFSIYQAESFTAYYESFKQDPQPVKTGIKYEPKIKIVSNKATI